MAIPEIPPELLQRFRDGRVTLFIGAGCCRSAGLPGWEDLLRRIERNFDSAHLLTPGDKGSLRSWFKRVDDYPRIAELFKSRDPQRYRELMQGIFDPGTRSPAFTPPRYFHLFRQLKLTRILTTNFDKLLEDALGLSWGSLTWQDQEELPRYLRDQQLGLLLHIHGRADRFGTLVHTHSEYQGLQGPNGSQTREFLKRIFETDTILSVGYRLADPVIRWLYDQLRSSWGIDPSWYSLAPTPSAEEQTKEWEERHLNLLGYLIDSSLSPDSAHESGLLEWFRQLAIELKVPLEDSQLSLAIPDDPEPGCIRIDSPFLDRQPPATPDLARAYYRGEPVRWSLVRAGLTAVRRATKEALAYLKSDGMRAVLLTGAGGEGKSTILLQVGLALHAEGWAVFHVTDPASNLLEILRRHRGPLAFLVDRADEFKPVRRLLREADRRGMPTALILAARPHEWQEANKDLGDEARLLKEIRIGRLGPDEAQDIATHLIETKSVEGTSPEVLAQRLLKDTNGFLLAAMLTATHGEPLSYILSDVVRRISEWPEGDQLLTAVACVVALEARKDSRGNSYWCSLRLFTEALGISKEKVRRLCGRLVGEVSLHLRSGYRVETRHPVIAETLFPILFQSEVPLVDEFDIHERLIRAAGILSREHVNPGERKLLSVLPLSYLKEGDFERARHLFKVAIQSDPRQTPTWQAWALLERDQQNVGTIDQPFTARWLFKKATEADPKNAPSWQAWALLERDQQNVGTIDQHFTARSLFKKATEADPKNAPSWQAWALLERDQQNVGTIDQHFTARWLFKKATEADPKHAPSWHAWADTEERLGSLEEARYILSQGMERCPGSPQLLDLQIKLARRPIDSLAQSIEQMIEMGRLDDAEQALKDALFINPMDTQLLGLHRRWNDIRNSKM